MAQGIRHRQADLPLHRGAQIARRSWRTAECPRFSGRLAFNFFDAEEGFFLGGTYLGKKKILSLGFAYDAHSELAPHRDTGLFAAVTQVRNEVLESALAALLGLALEEAIIESVSVRLRPILMTTVMLVAGMIPIALGRGPGAGNILIFNNGIGRGYSTINEIVPPVDLAGNYSISAGAAFGPTSPVWTYTATPPTNFYSAEISGAQRLPNGNTLICEGIKGNLFEVTAAGQTVWRYLCPVTTTIMTQGDAIPVDQARPDQFMNAVFRVTRYATDHPGLLGRDLTPQGSIELPVDQTLRIVSSQGTVTSRQFNWSSLPDKNYAILYKATLATPSWTSIDTNRSIGTLTYFTETNAVRMNQSPGFYRVTQLP